MESKIQMCLIQINIKIMLFVVMIENCGVVDQFIKPFKPCLKQDTVHNFMTSTINKIMKLLKALQNLGFETPLSRHW